jgi:hypothetical protein
MPIRRSFPAFALLALLAQPAFAAPACSVPAYVDDPDPAGTNVRAEPSTESEILAVIPHASEDDPEALAVEFEIIGFENGWARVANLPVGGGATVPMEPSFRGSGFISGRLIGFTINDRHLRAAPREDAPVVAVMQGDTWGPDSVEIRRVLDCAGDFAEIEITTPDGVKARGWATRICSNQLTTCP